MGKPSKKNFATPAPVGVNPLTNAQDALLAALKTSDVVVTTGPAGTGKTYVGAAWAAYCYSQRIVDRIVIVRPNVPSSRSLGFFPGALDVKMAPWVAPVMEVLNERLGAERVRCDMRSGRIAVQPFETMRGLSAEYSFVLLDEAQNTTPREMKMLLTRLGTGSRAIVNGDLKQSDLGDATSGLGHLIQLIEDQRLPVPVVKFSVEDCVRSEQCRMWIEAYEREGVF